MVSGLLGPLLSGSSASGCRCVWGAEGSSGSSLADVATLRTLTQLSWEEGEETRKGGMHVSRGSTGVTVGLHLSGVCVHACRCVPVVCACACMCVLMHVNTCSSGGLAAGLTAVPQGRAVVEVSVCTCVHACAAQI